MTARARCARGQATVELALVLPLVALLALAVVQVGLVVRAQILVVHAAREAAREAAVSHGDAAPRAAAARASSLKRATLRVDVQGRREQGSPVTAVVRYEVATDVPLVGALVPDVTVTASATMRAEHHAE